MSLYMHKKNVKLEYEVHNTLHMNMTNMQKYASPLC